MTTELVTLTIDGATVSVPKGTTLIEAAKQAGVLIPHYCYHPSLPSPAVCRMCLVEVEKAPKLLPACVTTVAEGQVVQVHSPAAEKAREGVLEFLLINHPLDCPICDQAGECELQDYVFQEGRAGTRYADYPKRFNPVEEFGPDVLYVPNRCILCTRCVRFMEAVAEAPVLNVSERGDRAYIGIDPDHALNHPWAGNVVDLCPVGSLISKDFLHKARAWDLDKSPSVCPGCSQGCNIMIDTRDDVVVRLRPRPNLDVNRHFMCDHGRLDYRWMNRGDRVEAPLVREAGRLRATDWEDALDRLAAVLLRRLAEATGGTVTAALHVPQGDEHALPGIPGLALRAERVPNVLGARLVGYDDSWEDALARVASAALVMVVDLDLPEVIDRLAAATGTVTVLDTVDREWPVTIAHVLPVATMAEERGTWINRDGRAQAYHPARHAPGMARPAWWVAAEAWSRLAPGRESETTVDDAMASLGSVLPALEGLTHSRLGLTGRIVATEGARA